MKSNLTKREMGRVRKQLGQAYRMLLANPTGHYYLDLAIQQDRDIAQRLANICGDERDDALEKYGKRFDTSQHQNGFNFRNELFNNEPFTITPGFIAAVRCALYLSLPSMCYHQINLSLLCNRTCLLSCRRKVELNSTLCPLLDLVDEQ